MIAQEVIRIDVDLLDDAAQSQLDDTPIVSGSAPAARLPSIHPFAMVVILVRDENSPARFQKVLFLREELVVREEDGAADACSGQINETGRRCYCWISRADLTAAIGAVSPWRNEQRNVILRGGIGDDETDRHAIEKAPFAKIIADEKNELEVAGNHFISGKQRGSRAPIGIRLNRLEQLRLISRPELDLHTRGRTAAHGIEDVSGEAIHSTMSRKRR